MSAAINEKDTMGRVTTRATIENLRDLWEAEKGDRPSQEVRRMTIDDALVGSGASTLSLPRSMIQQLGLSKMSDRRIITRRDPQLPSITALRGSRFRIGMPTLTSWKCLTAAPSW